MKSVEPRTLSIAEAHRELSARRMSCRELIESVLSAINELNPRLNAFTTICDEESLLRSADTHDENGVDPRRPLDGIPVALKDNYATAGLATSAGSMVLEGWVPRRDAWVVRALKSAGAIVIGKLNMHEFADGPTNDNPHTGRALNPWDTERTPGGSSGGSAVALATDMCMGATGTDTGGSIRTPAALSGVVGLKPTYGLVPRSGIVPFSYSLDHAGPMARTVADLALMLEAMIGHDPADPVSLTQTFHQPPRPQDDVSGLRIGVETTYTTALVDEHVRSVFERSLNDLQAQGAEVVEVEIPLLDAALAAETTILFSEALALHKELLKARPHDYSQGVMVSLLSGAYYSGPDYVAAQRYRALLTREIDDTLARVDLLAMPTVVMVAPRWGIESFDVGGETLDVLNAFIRLTAPFNLSGHPALSVPAGLTENNLPVGVQFAAARLREDILIRAATAIEHTVGRLHPLTLQVRPNADSR